MKIINWFRISLFVLITIFSFNPNASALLIDRGGGLIYDTDLSITWLQDANYAMTSGYDIDGQMNWYDAVAWADQLEYGGFDDWRLPITVYLSGLWRYDGSTTLGYNITTSEMGYMYYNNIGNLGYYDTSGSGPQTGWGLHNTGPFTNL